MRMAGELETALAFVARREGRTSMPADRWAHVLSFGLGWLPPAQARAFVQQGVEAAFLRSDGPDLRLTLDPASVAVPIGFRPSVPAEPPVPANPLARPAPKAGAAPAAQAGTEANVDPFLDWVQRLAVHTHVDRPRVLEQVAGVQAAMGGSLSALAALLWLAARAGLDVREAAAAAKP